MSSQRKTTSQPCSRTSGRSRGAIFPPPAIDVFKGHGRIETRSTRTSTALNDYVDFPHVGQVFRIHRQVTEVKTGKVRKETACGVTSLTPDRADPRRVGELVRGHWEIESLHWVRDMAFDEDRSRVRTKGGPHAFACLRNLAISCLRLAGWDNISKALRALGRNPLLAITLLGF